MSLSTVSFATLSTFVLLSFAKPSDDTHLNVSPNSVAPAREEINWLSIEEALKLNEKNPKKLYIDIYTEWCGWCKKMDKESFKDAGVIAEMNKNFYAVRYNAESKQEVVFNSIHFNYKREYQANEFAYMLLQGKLGYPSGVVINEQQKVLTQIPGYQTGPMLSQILAYFGTNTYLSKSWNDYAKPNKG